METQMNFNPGTPVKIKKTGAEGHVLIGPDADGKYIVKVDGLLCYHTEDEMSRRIVPTEEQQMRTERRDTEKFYHKYGRSESVVPLSHLRDNRSK